MQHQGARRRKRAGLSLAEFMERFPTNQAAEEWFLKTRWPDGVTCARCGSPNVTARKTTTPRQWHCRVCGLDFSVKAGTLMHKSPLSFRTWATALYLLSTSLKGTSSMKLHRDLAVTQKTAWYLAHRIREAWMQPPVPFSGPVEVDETYIGGKERNRRPAKKKRLGRGTVGKAIVVGMKDRPSGRVAARVVASNDARTLTGFVGRRTMPTAAVYTDDHPSYRGLHRHKTVRHSVGEYVRGGVHTNGIESFWSLFKRGYTGTYHKMSPKHLDRYVGEFEGRHNVRSLDTMDQMRLLAQGMVGKRLRYRDLVA